jgi:uncharacterized membrane protein
MHSHGADDVPQRTPVRLQWLLAALILPLVVLTVVGLVALWPDTSRRPTSPAFAAEGVTFPHGTVTRLDTFDCPVSDGSDPGGGDPGPFGGEMAPAAFTTSVGDAVPAADDDVAECGHAQVRVDDGVDSGLVVSVDVPPEIVAAGTGSGVVLMRTPEEEGAPATFFIYDLQRGKPLLGLALVFGLVVAAVAGLRGVRALLGLGFAAVVTVVFVLPSLLSDHNAVAVGLTGASAIMLVVLYVAHGVSGRTSTALLGTFCGLGLTALAGWLAVRAVHLTGLSNDDNYQLQFVASQLDLRALLTCGIILAGLGVLNDVTITQSSAVWELRAVSPSLTRRALYLRAMRIGRDHIASTVYTIVFAYAGAALPVLLLIELYGQPLRTVLTNADVAEELVRTMASAIGLVLAVPATTALAVAVATAAPAVARKEHRSRSARGASRRA